MVLRLPRLYQVFDRRFKYFIYALGHVELWKRSKKIGEFKRFIRTLQIVQYVRVMPDFKAFVFA
jgi:hypothetical protein